MEAARRTRELRLRFPRVAWTSFTSGVDDSRCRSDRVPVPLTLRSGSGPLPAEPTRITRRPNHLCVKTPPQETTSAPPETIIKNSYKQRVTRA